MPRKLKLKRAIFAPGNKNNPRKQSISERAIPRMNKVNATCATLIRGKISHRIAVLMKSGTAARNTAGETTAVEVFFPPRKK
jgi:hypothetical protein